MHTMNERDTWNGWTIDSFIGEGSFGKVYKIVRNEHGHKYESALKIIRVPRDNAERLSLKNSGMSDADITVYYRGMVKDLAKEVALLSELKGNSHIVSYEDHKIEELENEAGWEIFIRMELVVPLQQYIDEHPLSENEVIKLGSDLCKALEACRRFNIIHRDIKPENIFVSGQGEFKLGDFGIAKQLDDASAAMSKKGAPAYMAPEVYRGEKYDLTADIYSLGIVLYKLLNDGRTPFLPPAPDPIRFRDKEEAVVKRMTGEPFPPPCNASEEAARVILKACAFDPAGRYKNAADMRKDLESICSEKNDSNKEKSGTRKRLAALFLMGIVLIAGVFAYIQSNKTIVPDVTGKSEDEASAVIESAELEYNEQREFSNDIDQGIVIKSPMTGKKVRKGTQVDVVVSRGTPIETPNLIGKSPKEAKEISESKELNMEIVSEEYSDDVFKGAIMKQDPEAGEMAEKGQTIKAVKSKGREKVTVPDVTGMTPIEAREALTEAGLKIRVSGVNSDAPSGQIISQSLEPGSVVDHGKVVAVEYSIGTVSEEGKED